VFLISGKAITVKSNPNQIKLKSGGNPSLPLGFELKASHLEGRHSGGDRVWLCSPGARITGTCHHALGHSAEILLAANSV
jgi:hypothetical protein